MDIDADGLLKALRKAGLPVTGISIKDVDDPAFWEFQGLKDDQIEQAQQVVADLLHPIVVPPKASPVSLRAALLLFTDDEYAAIALSSSPAVVHFRAVLHAEETFDPSAVWLFQFFIACVLAKALTQDRAEAIQNQLNPPV